MRLVLAEPHRLVLESFAVALGRRGFDVVALAASPQEVFDQVAQHRPDICLLTTHFPTCSGLDVLRVITQRHPQVKTVMLSTGQDRGLMAAAVEGGAAGFISRNCHITDIVRTLPRVRRGEQVFDSALFEEVVRAFRLPGPDGGDWLRDRLTSREQEVLMRIVEGECTRQMARSLAISEATVRTHVQNVLVKLGVHSRLEASIVVAESGALGRCLPGAVVRAATGP
jgi:two-component system, NarL family, nitrate/nitrite response regulator NarL